MKKKRILFAAVDIGYRIECYSKFINSQFSDKLIPESFSKYVLPSSHYKTSYSYTCPVNKYPKIIVYAYSFFFFLYSIFKYDIIHYISGENILTRKLRRFEFFIFKLFKKRLIMHFVGSDIRSIKYSKWKSENIYDICNNAIGMDKPPLLEDYQASLVNDCLKYMDYILVSTPDLLEIIPSAHYYPVVIDFEKFKNECDINLKNKSDYPIKILHSPSHSYLKGSKDIYHTLDKLKLKHGNLIEIITPGIKNLNTWSYYSLTRYELFEEFMKSDYTIDQITTGWYGLKSIESVLSGNITFCYIEKNLEKYLFQSTPIINVNVLNLEKILNEFIEKKTKIDYKQHYLNIEWVKKNHTIENNNKTLLDAWGI